MAYMKEKKTFWQRFAPKKFYETLMDIDLKELRDMGIVGLIFDLDNTIVPWNEPEMPPEIVAWFEALPQAGFRACLLSNNLSNRIENAANRLGLQCVTKARKPLRSGFFRAMRVLHTTPKTTAVIGDQLFTDMWGGNKWQMYTILVKPLGAKEHWFTTNFSRRLEKVAKKKLRLPF